MENLQDKVVVITGGSKGFGLAIAKKLHAEGARLALFARHESDLKKAQQALGEDTVSIHTVDISVSAQIEQAFADAEKAHGKIDYFVNNAGLAKISRSDALKDEDISVQLNTNLLGNMISCRAAIPYLRKSAQLGSNARIVNISSATAYHSDEMAYMSVYAATKAAVERFSREIRRELELDEIGVSIVRPGAAMDTDFASNLDFNLLKPALDAWQDTGPYCYQGMDSSHVAEAVCFCLKTPKGVSVDLLEIRPNKRIKKPQF